jgi:hypothetical protein
VSVEIEVLDQLLGGDMPLSVVVSLFPDEAYARRAIVAMLTDGELALRDPDGLTLSLSQVRELERQPSPWNRHTQYRLALTDAGARRLGY